MKYVIIHGYGSSPETSKSVKIFKEMISEYDGNAEIITPTYDILNMDESINEIIKNVNVDTVLIGVSFGGFIARYVANVVKVSKLIMVNPAIHAYHDLKQFNEIPTNVCDQLVKYYVKEDSPVIGILVLLAMDDVIIDPKTTDALYENRAIVIHSNGGHRMTTLPLLSPHFEKFLNTISG